MRLPLARMVVTFSKPRDSRQEVSWSRLARRPPTLIARRKATWRGTGGSYSRSRRAAVTRGGLDVQLITRWNEADVRLAAAGDEEFLARRRTLHVPAEAIAEVVGAEYVLAKLSRRVELVGLEPTAS
jgi:hypothetical protein